MFTKAIPRLKLNLNNKTFWHFPQKLNKKMQQNESPINHGIYFTAQFKEWLKTFWKTYELQFKGIWNFQTFRLHKNMAFYTKQDFSAVSL